MQSVGFAPIASAQSCVLILGTLPGVKSLERGEYYAHPRNSFWWIMGELVGAGPELSYEERCRRVHESGLAVWDVCHSAEREGSLDADIVLPTLIPNDFNHFLSCHPQIENICFNGQPAERLFRRTVLPLDATIQPLTLFVLDSTSPANARISREGKLAHWRDCLAPLLIRQGRTRIDTWNCDCFGLH